jgi:hypothetical protein
VSRSAQMVQNINYESNETISATCLSPSIECLEEENSAGLTEQVSDHLTGHLQGMNLFKWNYGGIHMTVFARSHSQEAVHRKPFTISIGKKCLQITEIIRWRHLQGGIRNSHLQEVFTELQEHNSRKYPR